MPSLPAWLEKAVFYQIYPQSYYDSNGDGIGDLPGILQKLDYLQSLGVTALWLSPCFVSPFQDAGYDVSDYYQVAPRYGVNADVRRLCAAAQQRGLRILLDLVPGHTSLAHPWFKASGQAARNEYSDWYIWTNSAWTTPPGYQAIRAYAERDAGYITNFFYCQPALNYGFALPDPAQPWQQPVDAPGPLAVRRELRNIMQFWLDMGVSGFRVDMAGSLVKGDAAGQATAQLWREIRTWLDTDYPDAALVSEWGNPKVAIGQGGFHMDFALTWAVPGMLSLFRKATGDGVAYDPYGWSFFDRLGHGNIREFLDGYLPHYTATKNQGHISFFSGNHDHCPRLARDRTPDDLEIIFMFLLTMPGVPFIYYGDEIGMRGLQGLPSKEGGYNRTQLRTPMQWDTSANAGFSTAPGGQLYLPIEPEPDRPTVAAQDGDPQSVLNRVRRLIALRQKHPALCASGDFEPVYAVAGRYPFVYQRIGSGETLLIALNPSERPVDVELPGDLSTTPPQPLYGQPAAWEKRGPSWKLSLPGVSGGVYQTD